jgi:hypothetical protein
MLHPAQRPARISFFPCSTKILHNQASLKTIRRSPCRAYVRLILGNAERRDFAGERPPHQEGAYGIILSGQRAKPLQKAIQKFLPEIKAGTLQDMIYVETDNLHQIVRIELLDTKLGQEYYTAKESNVGRVYNPLRGGKAFRDVTKAADKDLAAAGKSPVGVAGNEGGKREYKKPSQLENNKLHGSDFEKIQKEILINEKGELDVEEQISVVTESGIKTRIDFFSKHPETGDIILSEIKSSKTAPFTRNQKKAFPEIETTGATVVGKGKGIYRKGVKVPSLKVRIIRPEGK